MQQLVDVVVLVADGGAGCGLQVEDFVGLGFGCLCGDCCGEAGDGVVVVHLGCNGAKGRPVVGRSVAIFSFVVTTDASAVQEHAHRGPVAAGQVSKPVVGEYVAFPLRRHQGPFSE